MKELDIIELMVTMYMLRANSRHGIGDYLKFENHD